MEGLFVGGINSFGMCVIPGSGLFKSSILVSNHDVDIVYPLRGATLVSLVCV